MYLNHIPELDRLLGAWADRDPNWPNAGTLNAGHEAVERIDALITEASKTRQRLVSELTQAHRVADERIDERIEQRRATDNA